MFINPKCVLWTRSVDTIKSELRYMNCILHCTSIHPDFCKASHCFSYSVHPEDLPYMTNAQEHCMVLLAFFKNAVQYSLPYYVQTQAGLFCITKKSII